MNKLKSKIVGVKKRTKHNISKRRIGYQCRLCSGFAKKVPEFREGECPEFQQHEWKPIYKSLIVKMPFWVLIDLVDEKRQWLEDAKTRKEQIPPFEMWIIEELSFAADLVDGVMEAEKDLEELWNEKQKIKR